jgi:hypothetical protein
MLNAYSRAAQAYLHKVGLEGLHAYPMQPGAVIVITDPLGWGALVGVWVSYAFFCSVVIVELLSILRPPSGLRS